METAFLDERIAYTKTLITNIETAITELVVNGVVSYSVDTGQTRQSVTKSDIPRLNETLESLYNRYAVLYQRRYGCAATIVRPSW